MKVLRVNLGPAFWHHNVMLDTSLIIMHEKKNKKKTRKKQESYVSPKNFHWSCESWDPRQETDVTKSLWCETEKRYMVKQQNKKKATETDFSIQDTSKYFDKHFFLDSQYKLARYSTSTIYTSFFLSIADDVLSVYKFKLFCHHLS